MLRADYNFKVTYLNQWRVGKPLISNRSARAFCSVASTLAMVRGGSCAFSTSAAPSYSGASFLQWPLDTKNVSHMFSQNALDTDKIFEPTITNRCLGCDWKRILTTRERRIQQVSNRIWQLLHRSCRQRARALRCPTPPRR